MPSELVHKSPGDILARVEYESSDHHFFSAVRTQQGDMPYVDASGRAKPISPGAKGQVLKALGAAAPLWVGSLSLIESITAPGDITEALFDNIPQDFQHLLLTAHLRTSGTLGSSWLLAKLNADALLGVSQRGRTTYQYICLTAFITTTPTTVAGTLGDLPDTVLSTSSHVANEGHAANVFSDFIFLLLNYHSARPKLGQFFGAGYYTDSIHPLWHSGTWSFNAPEPITDISLFPWPSGVGQYFKLGSKFCLYGVGI